MAKITTQKYQTDFKNGRKEIVGITRTEYPKSGYTKTTRITTTYSDSNAFNQLNLSNEKKIYQLQSPKITKFGNESVFMTNIKFEPIVKTIGRNNIIARLPYEPVYQSRFTYSGLSNAKITPTTSKKIVESPNRSSTLANYLTRYPDLKDKTITKGQNHNISFKTSIPAVNKIVPPLFTEDFQKKINICDSKKKRNPGKLFIFNNDEFQDRTNEYRQGSKFDVKMLEQTFKRYNVKVTICNNYTVKKIKNQVDKIYKEDFSKNSCIVIAILSHGNRMERIAAYDGSYSIDDDILFPILRNKTIQGKPKILIVQACKGDVDLREFKTDSCKFTPIPLIPDEIYKFYSTSEGFVSYRNEKGSIFITAFCKELEKSGSDKSIRDIMESAIKAIKSGTNGQQIPSMCVNNTEPYIFGNHC